MVAVADRSPVTTRDSDVAGLLVVHSFASVAAVHFGGQCPQVSLVLYLIGVPSRAVAILVPLFPLGVEGDIARRAFINLRDGIACKVGFLKPPTEVIAVADGRVKVVG